MNRALRRSLAIGAMTGLIVGLALPRAIGGWGAALTLGPLFGVLLALGFPPGRGAAVDAAVTGAALGVGVWALVPVSFGSIAGGGGFAWSTESIRAAFPWMPGWVLFGGVSGLALHLAEMVAARVAPAPSDEGTEDAAGPARQVVILGGGFGGFYTAMQLEEEIGADRTIAITLVSETNALLFTPMLAEVAGSSLEPTHISTPLRGSLHRTRVVRGRAVAVDTAHKRVRVAAFSPVAEPGEDVVEELPYDQLVVALGAISNYPAPRGGGRSGVRDNAMDFKTLADAMRIRNHVIDMFEAADREPDPARRRELVTFVVAGGGFAGVELAGSLNDFGRGMLADYPRVAAEDVQVILVHSRDRILPELSESLAAYALEKMRARGVVFKLGVRLGDARPGVVVLEPDQEIPARTLVWTAGTAPNPLPREAGLPVDKRGAVVVDTTLAVQGFPEVWALGDIAAVIDGKTGHPCPPTAQFALREARALARNIHAALEGRPPKPFHFDSLGTLCVVGHQVACAELPVPFLPGKAIRVSGLLAWLMWRAIYLSKLPGMERRVRVLSDWIVELFFPRDVVQTMEARRPGASDGER